jgi:AbrB family transcriptional regulator (stage V sporulation protein T)
VITDRDQIVAYAGPNKREFAERPLSAQAEELISARKSLGGGDLPLLKDTDKHRLAAARPILAGGDVLGMIGFLAAEGKSIGEGEEKLLQAGALFLAKQLEL